ncbi:hypothetical protein FOL47_000952 [Perkinsus chesapeaki]|uniref:Ankyrin repeat domain-containing protein n=1 Tax=Perkinsus chesapeaki TaxID=330153 RepID=A0A7J6MKQ7_PERCH|nr:hypothetical protein FOL47_000952 [Perkinsus chesapeaki]
MPHVVLFVLKMNSEEEVELFEYSRRGNFEEVHRLLVVDKSVKPDDYEAYDGSTPFLMACRNGHTDVAKLLLEHGANINAKTEDLSNCLILASAGRSPETVKLLLEKGVDVNYANEDGVTALELAKEHERSDVANILRSAGAAEPEDKRELPPAKPSERWQYGAFE